MSQEWQCATRGDIFSLKKNCIGSRMAQEWLRDGSTQRWANDGHVAVCNKEARASSKKPFLGWCSRMAQGWLEDGSRMAQGRRHLFFKKLFFGDDSRMTHGWLRDEDKGWATEQPGAWAFKNIWSGDQKGVLPHFPWGTQRETGSIPPHIKTCMVTRHKQWGYPRLVLWCAQRGPIYSYKKRVFRGSNRVSTGKTKENSFPPSKNARFPPCFPIEPLKHRIL